MNSEWIKEEEDKFFEFIKNSTDDEFQEFLKECNTEYYNNIKVRLFSLPDMTLP